MVFSSNTGKMGSISLKNGMDMVDLLLADAEIAEVPQILNNSAGVAGDGVAVTIDGQADVLVKAAGGCAVPNAAVGSAIQDLNDLRCLDLRQCGMDFFVPLDKMQLHRSPGFKLGSRAATQRQQERQKDHQAEYSFHRQNLLFRSIQNHQTVVKSHSFCTIIIFFD